MIYNEYSQLVDAGVKESELTTFFMKIRASLLEDGLYVLDSSLKDKVLSPRCSSS